MNRLVGDIGGSHTRLGVWNGVEIVSVRLYDNDDYRDPLALFQDYLAGLPLDLYPQQARLAVAAPVISDEVRLTNRDWRLHKQRLCEALGMRSVELFNDFAAVALGVSGLSSSECRQIGGGIAVPGATQLALGPGTGFGMAGVVHVGGRWTPVSSEGGHAMLAILTQRELDIVARLQAPGQPVSIESVLSGPGLLNLCRAVAALDGLPAVPQTQEDVTRLARQGDALALETLEIFFRFLGRTAGDMALAFNARGGVYLAGGILPKLLPELERSGFRNAFENKGRFADYMAAIPTFLVTDPLVAFRGLASLP
ncbi:MAG: glucokinase [Gammaproteobacteria bacterium]|nr:glucokinase [Gammaproteobacteria bacterium]